MYKLELSNKFLSKYTVIYYTSSPTFKIMNFNFIMLYIILLFKINKRKTFLQHGVFPLNDEVTVDKLYSFIVYLFNNLSQIIF